MAFVNYQLEDGYGSDQQGFGMDPSQSVYACVCVFMCGI